ENRRTILGADVRPLAIELSRVVGVEKYIQQLVEADPARVIRDPNHFRVAGVSLANPLVIGRGLLTAGVTAFHIQDAVELFERRLGAPKTTAGQHDRRGL